MKQTANSKRKTEECAACLKYSARIFVEKIYKMEFLEVTGAERPIEGSLGVKGLRVNGGTPPICHMNCCVQQS
jgi:hypothetical protein